MATPAPTLDRLARPAVDELLVSNGELIARLKLSFGFDRPTFDQEVMPLVRAYAGYVGALPATAEDFFDRPGDLFRLGLETAFYSVQGTDAHIFSGRATISARRKLEPRWRQATFIAGLCGELHRALDLVEVLDASGTRWPAYLHPLSSWLQGDGRLRWRPEPVETRSLGLLVLPQIVPSAVIHHLAEDNDLIVPHLLASIGGLPLYRGRNVLDELVRRAFALVVERDLQVRGRWTSARGQRSHHARYLVEGLQRLIASDSAWQPNQDKSRIWYARDGLFLIWPGAAQDLCRLLEGEQLAGMPDAPEAVLSRLVDANLIEMRSQDDPTWAIRVPGTTSPLPALKFASPALLLGGLESVIEPMEGPLVPAGTQAHPDATSATAAGPQLPLDGVPPDPPGTAAAPADDAATPGWQLKAPLRLNTAVRQALASALAAPADGIVRLPEEHALFIPLHLFDAHRIAPALAIRALAELGMLVLEGSDAPPTVERRIGAGEHIVGIRLKERFIEFAGAPAPTPLSLDDHHDADATL